MNTNLDDRNISEQLSELNLRDIFFLLWEGKKLILIITSIFSLSAVIFSLMLPNIYNAKTLLSPNQSNQDSMSQALDGYGSLAGLAGIEIGSMNTDNTLVAIETLKSFKFFNENFLPNINLEDLMAVKSWNLKTNTLKYDKSIYVKDKNSWVRKVNLPRSQKPSAQEAHEEFLSDFFEVTQDKETNFVTLSIEHQSPFLAKEWLDILILQINKVLREKEKKRATESIDFLTKQIALTSYSEVKQALAQVLQKESEKLMLVEVNEDYVFDSLDPPFVPEMKAKPRRSLICILGALLGCLLGSAIILSKKYFKRD